ncbi:hypothetical protein Pint_31167 [Pistacia integerrima]|uniref:Uncharacterized protein n=2 Tax=Pistacia integerrima TaxID=434235 RepID=A0ACC0XNH2_9ROSI|nr:hypothetical protein Pint_31169 [Pistacia integerrima]KAJ0019956.1 hypothetical protein Pint_31167 [Pistacia integerrima]
MKAAPTAIEQIDKSDDASADIENTAASLKRELQCIRPSLISEGCIHRVPDRARRSNEFFFTPRVVSIGPFHHGADELKRMEDYKRNCLAGFLQRTEVKLEKFVEVTKRNEVRLRNCYEEIGGLNSHDFVKMVLLDSAFIIEVLLEDISPDDEVPDCEKSLYSKKLLLHEIRYDMILVENQLPFFILEELFILANITIDDQRPSMLELTHDFCNNYWNDFLDVDNFGESHYSGVLHFVDFFRTCILPSDLLEKKAAGVPAPSVTQLHQAGVKFERGSINKFEIIFKNGILEFPRLLIHPTLGIVLRNLLAFEQYHNLPGFINDYIFFMNNLLRSAKDVDLLAGSGILKHSLRNSEGVSILFHDLVELTGSMGGYYYSSLSKDLNRYCEASCNKWMANLKQDYFNTPWSIISFIAAAVLLILTFIQTVRSFYN